MEDGWTGIWASADSAMAAEVARRGSGPRRLGGESHGTSPAPGAVQVTDPRVGEVAALDGQRVARLRAHALEEEAQ